MIRQVVLIYLCCVLTLGDSYQVVVDKKALTIDKGELTTDSKCNEQANAGKEACEGAEKHCDEVGCKFEGTLSSIGFNRKTYYGCYWNEVATEDHKKCRMISDGADSVVGFFQAKAHDVADKLKSFFKPLGTLVTCSVHSLKLFLAAGEFQYSALYLVESFLKCWVERTGGCGRGVSSLPEALTGITVNKNFRWLWDWGVVGLFNTDAQAYGVVALKLTEKLTPLLDKKLGDFIKSGCAGASLLRFSVKAALSVATVTIPFFGFVAGWVDKKITPPDCCTMQTPAHLYYCIAPACGRLLGRCENAGNKCCCKENQGFIEKEKEEEPRSMIEKEKEEEPRSMIKK